MSFFNIDNHNPSHWKGYEKVLLRFSFLYFIIQVVPLDWKFYRELLSINWLHVNFYDLFTLSQYSPQFFTLTGYANWLIAAALAIAGTAVWSFTDKKERDYDSILYWLRVILRYRLAVGIIAYGLLKLFPMQMPYPSLSNLYTNYGQFLPWKIYFHTIGITPWYESVLGAVEIVAAFLLFFRKTTTIGTGIILGFLGNVLFANTAYDLGDQVYCAYLLVIAVFLFAYDIPRLYTLLFLERKTIADKFTPVFSNDLLRKTRIGLKAAFVFYALVFGVKTYANYTTDPYKTPAAQGLSGTYGFYNVREFKLNNTLIPYSTTDQNRWQNVVFEKWATISIKIAKPAKVDNSRGDNFSPADIDRNYESSGIGDRRYFSYSADTIKKTIFLKNKNRYHAEEKFSLTYFRLNDSTIIVRGLNEKKDSVYAVLDKINKKHLLFVGRRSPLTL